MDISSSCKAFASLTLLLLVVTAQYAQAQQKYCGGQPADLVFVMDSSGSIGAADFRRQKHFIKGMVDLFETDTGKIRVGLVAYSNWAFLEFHLNTYSNRRDIKARIDAVRHFRGDTNTGSAIAYVRDVMFSEHNGARDGVPRIAIVLTDGRSNDPVFTMQEAARAHAQNIVLFALGVGDDISSYELTSIASDPDDEFSYQVADYQALEYIKDLLAIKACEVPPPPRKYPTTTTLAPDLACADTALADIVYAVSPAASHDATDKTLGFFRQLTSGFDMSGDKIRVGLVPKDCVKTPDVTVGATDTKSDILKQLDDFMTSQPTVAGVLRYLRRNSFSAKRGGRSAAAKRAVLFVDETDDLLRTKHEARKARDVSDIELFVIAVGRKFNAKKLRNIASLPLDEHLFIVPSYEHLPGLLRRLQVSVCPPVGS